MSNGQRNPAWERDELILALDLYFRFPSQTLSPQHPEVIELSQILNALPLHPKRPDAQRFRNPNGVHLKLCNFLRLDPNYAGTGLSHGGKLELEVWNQFASDSVALRGVAERIRQSARSAEAANMDEADEDDIFPEGKILYRLHRARERNNTVVAKAKELARKRGVFYCWVCGFNFEKTYGKLGEGFIECHHVTPLSLIEPETRTRIRDLALVCSNCHRMLHRKRPWLTLDELSTLLEQNNSK